MCSSDLVFWKYKQDSSFCVHVNGVLQLAKTGPLIAKDFPLLCLFLSDAMMAIMFYTLYDVNCTNFHILTAHGMSHFDSYWPTLKLEKKFVCACLKPKPENY